MTGPIRDTTGERIQDVFVESPTRANKTAVEVYIGGSASGGGGSGLNQLTEKTSVTITSLTVNTWVTVPITTINVISDLSAFDQSDYEEVVLAWRVISSGSQVQIKSKIENTFTIHVEGYLV